MNTEDNYDIPDLTQLKEYYSWNQRSGISLAAYADYNLLADSLIALTSVFFPNFVSYKGAIILDWRFSSENFETWYRELNGNIREIEIKLNTIEIGGILFPHTLRDQPYQNIAYIGSKIARSWQNELKYKFPDNTFTVLGEKDALFEDFFVSFWQSSET